MIALRSGDVVIRNGQSLFIAEINSTNIDNIRSEINNIIINANRFTHKLVKPKSKDIRRLLLLRKNHIEELQKKVSQGGDWVINIKSVRNVLSGENFVYAFPEILDNKIIVEKGEVITKVNIIKEEFNYKSLGEQVNFLLTSSLSEMKRRGSLTNEIKLRSDSVKKLKDFIIKNNANNFEVEAVSMRNSKTAQSVIVELNINELTS